MNAFMTTTRPSVFTKSNMEGVERVQRANGAYAYMMEATSIEFFTERKCDVMKIGGMLDSKGYGIAMRPGSPEIFSYLSFLFVSTHALSLLTTIE